jgi:1-acyl-sn-glycerol-3-phosphate acyltransferase
VTGSETGATTVGAKDDRRDVKPYTYRGEGTHWIQAWYWDVGRFISRIISVLWFHITVGGLTNIPKTGPVLFVTNHQSYLDPWLVGIGPNRQIHSMARDTLFKGSIKPWLMERLNAFPIKRGAADRAALSMAVDRLERGFIVNIFPEGTRSEDGTIGPIAPGMAIILNRCKRDVPIVPVMIDGAFQAWPRNRKLPMVHPIRMLHGKPIPASEWRKMSPDELADRVRLEMVRLQEQIGSEFAAASRERLERESAAPKARRSRR